ncbi:MAG: hypothetical protein HFH05_08080 [Lachnospiraceae bacterium]|jgi:hypothetical protein|nr:hypothetical protein [Lachnospiraceae bacterium]MCI9675557.1 hypothetical protein [Lachnospiraceae bacterium]
MKKKEEIKKFPFWDEKKLRKVPFLLYENYNVTKEELDECKRIIEELKKRAQSSSAQ